MGFFQEPILKIWLQIVVKAGAINFDALHQLLYLSYLKLLLICLLQLGFGFDQSLPRGKPVGKSPYYRSFDRSANWRVKDSMSPGRIVGKTPRTKFCQHHGTHFRPTLYCKNVLWMMIHHWLCNQKHPWGICSCSPIVNFLKVTFYHEMVSLVIFLIKKSSK